MARAAGRRSDWRGPGVDAAGKRCIGAEERELAARLARARPTRGPSLHARRRPDVSRAGAHSTRSRAASPTHPARGSLAGGTDVGLWVTKQQRALGDARSTSARVAELRAIDRSADGCVEIGAAAPLDRRVRGARDRVAGARRGLGALRLGADPQRRHAGRQRRQRLADRRFDAGADRARRGSRAAAPGGDRARDAARGLLPRLPADGARAGRVPAARPCPAPRGRSTLLRAYKVSKRHDQDISAVFVAFRARPRRRRASRAARIGFGGMAATPRRATATEARARRAAPGREATARAAGEVLDDRVHADLRPARRAPPTGGSCSRACCWRCWLETGAGARRRCAAARPATSRPESAESPPPMDAPLRTPSPAPPSRTTRPGCTSPAPPRYTDDLPEPAGTLHARARHRARWRTGALARRRPRRGARRARRRRRDRRRPTCRGANDVGPIVARRPDPRRRRSAVRRPAGVRRARRRSSRRARAAARLARFDIEPLPAMPHHRRGAAPPSRTCCRRRTSRAATPAAALAARAAPARRHAARAAARTTSTSRARSRSRCRGEDGGMLRPLLDAAPGRGPAHRRRTRSASPTTDVTVECRRMGGGFGGKETQMSQFACLAAVARAAHRPGGQAAARPRRRHGR